MAAGIAAGAEAIPTVSLDPACSRVDPGEVFDVSVRIADEPDTISTFQVIFQFDPDVIEFQNAFEGSLYTHLHSGFWTWFGVEQESLGTWEVFDVVFPSGSYVLPPGELARLRFRALEDGYSPIRFLSVFVMDIERYPLSPLVWEDGSVYVGNVSSVDSDDGGRDGAFLDRPFPNPSRGPTSVRLGRELPAGEAIDLAVYDALGRCLRRWAGPLRPGDTVRWDARDPQGRDVPPGLYFFRLTLPGGGVTRKVVIVR